MICLRPRFNKQRLSGHDAKKVCQCKKFSISAGVPQLKKASLLK